MALLATCFLLFAPAHAQARLHCGEVHRKPTGGVEGRAPLALGDSVMLGAAWKMSARGFEVDAVCGRSPAGGLYTLRHRLRNGTLPSVVVFGLGTNIYMTSRDIGRVLRLLGPRRMLVLVTPFRSGRPFGTGPMRRAARRRPGRIELADWASLARGHREWFVGDGTHLTDRGELAYTNLLHRAAWAHQRARIVKR